MRIWISTAGWRLTRAFVEFLLLYALLCLAGADAFARDKGKEETPDMEMLEFLGTFETAGGKVIDPMKLPERSQDGKVAAKPAAKGSNGINPDRKIKEESDD